MIGGGGMTLLEKVKANLILQHDADDELLQLYITAAVSYAESYQHLPAGTYESAAMPPTTEQAVIMVGTASFAEVTAALLIPPRLVMALIALRL